MSKLSKLANISHPHLLKIYKIEKSTPRQSVLELQNHGQSHTEAIGLQL